VSQAKGKRGKCRWCARRFALTKDGRVRRHIARPGVSSVICEGSGQVPA
jgi:hypothetical protein